MDRALDSLLSNLLEKSLMEEEFVLEVAYSQVAVFWADLPEPFNDWSDAHVEQGFSWRQGSVSFKTLDAAGKIRISVTTQHLDLGDSSANRIICVPFNVRRGGKIEIATIAQSQRLEVPAGDYSLTFEHGTDSRGMWCALRFVQTTDEVIPEIVRADSDLSPTIPLLMEASPG